MVSGLNIHPLDHQKVRHVEAGPLKVDSLDWSWQEWYLEGKINGVSEVPNLWVVAGSKYLKGEKLKPGPESAT